MRVVFLCVFVVFTLQTFSQEYNEVVKKYDKEFIYRYGAGYRKGAEKIRFNDLMREFKPSSLSLEFYKKAKLNRTIGNVLRYASIICIVGVIKGISNNNSSPSYGFLGGQLVLTMTGNIFRSSSVTNMDKALQIYNRELLFPEK